MKTYKLTLSGLSQKQVFAVIDSLPREGTKPVVEAENDGPGRVITETKKYKVGQPTDILKLTGKKATEGSMRASILKTLEKLEAKDGVGEVSREALRLAVIKAKLDSQIIYQLIRDGYIESRPQNRGTK